METRTIAPPSTVYLATTTPRVTPTPPSATKFGDLLANTAVQSAEQAMTALPGGPMMALALRGGAAPVPLGTSSLALSTSTSSSPQGPSATAPAASPFGTAVGIPGAAPSASGIGTAAIDAATGTSAAATDPASIQSSLQQSADMNMYMLQVQQQVQQQSQQFTTLSNVMKAQYDTVKNAIGNIR